MRSGSSLAGSAALTSHRCLVWQVGQLQSEIDGAYKSAFEGVQLSEDANTVQETSKVFSEAAFSRLGRNNPKVNNCSVACVHLGHIIGAVWDISNKHAFPATK